VVEVRVPRPASVHAVAILAALAARRRRGPDAVVAYQLARARDLARHAAANVPAYAGLLSTQDADRLRTLDDLRRLPTVDKAHFLSFDVDHRTWEVPGLDSHLSSTSGTSGEAFGVPWPPWASWRNGVQRLLMMREMRIGLLDRQASLVPPRRAHLVKTMNERRRGLSRLVAGRRTPLSESEPAVANADALLRLRPDWLTAEPHSLAAVGEALQGRLRPSTLTTYGVALDGVLRAELRAAYGTEPLDIYGAAEAGQMAWQCRAADLYHVAHETTILEVVDDDGRPQPPGEAGDVLLTSLLNPLLPMLRYRIGDGAVWADRPCTCGHRLPALAAIVGRRFDWLVDDAGRRVAPQRLWMSSLVGERVTQVRRYRMAQDERGRVVVEAVAADGAFANGGPDLVRAGLQRILGASTPVEVRLVDEIVIPPGRRFRQFTSQRSG